LTEAGCSGVAIEPNASMAAYASLTARILGPRWHEYVPPSVQRVFSLHALRLLLADYGFVLRTWGHPPKYIRADHVLSLIQSKANAPLVLAALACLANVVPADAELRYLADDITWALFEKTLENSEAEMRVLSQSGAQVNGVT
jgi:hypothetical protein